MARVALVTLGCPKNSVSSRNMERLLIELGHECERDPSEADVVVVNSCGFIEPAKQESIETALRLVSEAARPKPQVFLAGCLAERYGEELLAELPELSGVLGFSEVEGFFRSLSLEGRADTPGSFSPVRAVPWAYLQLADGCSRACSFCAIPLIKGVYRSRPYGEVLDEARYLVGSGARELVLVAQDLGLFGFDTEGRALLPRLIEELSQIDNLAWIRLMYLHPQTVTDRLLSLLAVNNKLVPYVDMPLQHASGRLLRRMNRAGDGESNLALIRRLREARADVWLRTELIVGFPGEDASDFSELLDFVSEARLDYVGIFSFSPEEGTEAYRLKPRVSRKTAASREAELRELADIIALERKQRLVGKTVRALLEERVDDARWRARHEGQAPEVDGEVTLVSTKPKAVGEIVAAEITKIDGYDLAGDIAE